VAITARGYDSSFPAKSQQPTHVQTLNLPVQEVPMSIAMFVIHFQTPLFNEPLLLGYCCSYRASSVDASGIKSSKYVSKIHDSGVPLHPDHVISPSRAKNQTALMNQPSAPGKAGDCNFNRRSILFHRGLRHRHPPGCIRRPPPIAEP
jgi:hypothetical protein